MSQDIIISPVPFPWTLPLKVANVSLRAANHKGIRNGRVAGWERKVVAKNVPASPIPVASVVLMIVYV
jgi:hypothetical protein